MTQEIKYNGYSEVPSDYECPDGDMALSVNLVRENGALHPLMPPSTLFTLSTNQQVIYVHKTASFKHYIVAETDSNGSIKLFWRTERGELKPFGTNTYNKIYQLASIGNTLNVLASDGVFYHLWQGDYYQFLGDHLPECPISFGLRGEEKSLGAEIANSPIAYDTATRRVWFTDTSRINMDDVYAEVNTFINNNSTKAGKFIFPFFVRYAYRLYDGTLTMHSAPILMMASNIYTKQPQDKKVLACVPLWRVLNIDGNDQLDGDVCAIVSTLDYCVLQGVKEKLSTWKDVISSVDIFISDPIYTLNQNGINSELALDTFENTATCSLVKLGDNEYYTTNTPNRHLRTFVNDMALSLQQKSFSPHVMVLPRKPLDIVTNEIKSKHLFYLVKSIPIHELKEERTVVDMPTGILESLETQEVMTDDYISHDLLVARCAHTYNSRLHLAGISRMLFRGFEPLASQTLTNGAQGDLYALAIYYFIKQDGHNIVVKTTGGQLAKSTPLYWLFYPNTSAYKAVIQLQQQLPSGTYNEAQYFEVELKPHDHLNGAFAFSENPKGFLSDEYDKTPEYPNAPGYDGNPESRTVPYLNKVYSSEANNPFLYPATGIYTLGAGDITALSSATKAISEGQFGQFPLYAFTSEGIWALEVSATGSFSARQPVTRDVCNNPLSITQLDSAVLFTTESRIMLLDGAKSICISENIHADIPFSPHALPGFPTLQTLWNKKRTRTFSILSLANFLKDCSAIYDYRHTHIIVFNPNADYAYVFSLQSKAWGMTDTHISSRISYYPDALAMGKDGRVLNFSLSDCEAVVPCLFVTRPLKFGLPGVLKTIDNLVQRGLFRKGDVNTVLYGSRNLVHWHLIASSTFHRITGIRGTPYTYFRIAGTANLEADESLFGASLTLRPKYTAKLR